jgi:DNA-binding NtrC family response regulator
MEFLSRHSWPGNVRELANIVERLAILHPGAEVTASQVTEVLGPPGLPVRRSDSPVDSPSAIAATGTMPTANGGLTEMLDSFERLTIARALDAARGNIAEAARRLRTDRPNLYRRMKRLGMESAKTPERGEGRQ